MHMRSIITMLGGMLAFWVVPLAAQQMGGPSALHPAVIRAFQTADATPLMPLLNMQVELHLPDQEGIYHRSQAIVILQNFLRSRQVKSFSVLHQGRDEEGSAYFIGLTQGDAPYRVYIFQKQSPAGPVIQEIRIDPQ